MSMLHATLHSVKVVMWTLAFTGAWFAGQPPFTAGSTVQATAVAYCISAVVDGQ